VNLVANEGVDRPVVERLRQDGHDVVYVAELSPSITDEEVLQQANARSAVLLTTDKDFGELVFRQDRVHSGVLLLRLAGLAIRSAFDERHEFPRRVELQASPDGLRGRG
jgi:predicted nuclease of predicted toxin-antitoxin system